jgi:hypothetical protein
MLVRFIFGKFKAVAALTEIIVSLLKHRMARAGHTSRGVIGLRISILNGVSAKL